MANRRNGKVARLPKETRDVVNAMIRDGRTYADIIRETGAQVNEQNLTNWKEGGHQDWLKEQERLEDMRAKREFALEVVKQNEGSKLHEATLHLAASQLYEALTDFDLSALKALLAAKPENYANIVNALAKLSKGALDIEKYKEAVRERKEKIAGLLKPGRDRGLSPEAIRQIEDEVKLL